MLAAGGIRVFVAHRVAGVHVIPQEWLDAWRPSGFREATAREVLGWYDERDIDPPAEVLRAVQEAGPRSSDSQDGDVRGAVPITLRAAAQPTQRGPAVPAGL
jgi:hypothetical protein